MVAAKLIDIGVEGRQRMDRYELVGEIASGGMATVFLGRLGGMGGFQRFVAIKRLHPHLAGEREFVEMFLDEARLAAQIHHPNVVPILEVGASERGYYLVMEYIEGDTLARLMARAATSGKKLPLAVGIRIVVDMLTGLHAAHELKDETGASYELVHRDVSPQNVLVGIDGSARITDFGVARAEARLSATRVGQLKGKLAYMAPEQAQGSPTVDRRADVFSAGIVLWEVLAARRLFKAENEAATLSRVVSEPIAKVSQVSPDVPLRLSNVVAKALERDVSARYATCQEFADALEEAARAVNLLATPRELAQYTSEVLGQEIAQAREAVRAWLARSEPSQAAPSEYLESLGHDAVALGSASSVSAATLSLPGGGVYSGVTSIDGAPPPAAPAPGRRRALYVGAAAVAVLAVGAAFFLGRRSPEPAAAGEGSGAPVKTAAAAAPQAAPTSAPAAPEATVAPSSSALAEPTPAAPATVPVSAPPRAVAPSRPAEPREPKKPAEPAGKAGGGDVDLSNPYR